MFGVGQRERRDAELALGLHMQHHPARDDELELGAGGQQFGHLHGSRDDLLEVVQQQQHLLVLEGGFQ